MRNTPSGSISFHLGINTRQGKAQFFSVYLSPAPQRAEAHSRQGLGDPVRAGGWRAPGAAVAARPQSAEFLLGPWSH